MNSYSHLLALVDALDRTNWSSWQATAEFTNELEAARKYIEEHKDEQKTP